MAKKEKKKTHMTVEFADGPRAGQTMDVCIPPPERMRLAFPEWCHYYLREDGKYYYDMETPWVSRRANL